MSGHHEGGDGQNASRVPRSTDAARRRLPVPLTSFVGRREDIQSVLKLLERDDATLVTLTGPGGIGKTRLSIEVGRQSERRFGDHITFVSLASLEDARNVMPAIADALGLDDTRSVPLIPRIARALPDAPALLILDNLEQVIDAATDIAELLAAVPKLIILATSRSPLHIQGEREYALSQLEAPDLSNSLSANRIAAIESVALFVERAQAIDHSFALTDRNAATVAEICARLDGLPLAIELAAARIKVLPPVALLERLDNRLEILRGSVRDAPPRLRTMRAAIDWSYNLLEPWEQTLFRKLSVFRTGFTLTFAENAFGRQDLNILEGINSLVDKSLLAPRSPVGDEPSFQMMEVIRQYAFEQLESSGELDAARRRHAEILAAIADQARDSFLGPSQGEWFALFRRHHDDLRLALDWAETSDEWALAARLSGTLWKFWWMDSHVSEGRRRLAAILEHDRDLPADILADLCFGASVLAWGQQDLEDALKCALRLQRLASETSNSHSEALALYITGMGNLADDPERRLARALKIWQQRRDEAWISFTLEELAVCALERGDLERALDLSEASLNSAERCGHLWGIGATRAGHARVLSRAGRDADAIEHFQKSLRLFLDLGARGMIPSVLDHLASLAGKTGNHRRAAHLFGYTARLRETMAFPPRIVDRKALDDAAATARQHLGIATFDSEWDAGSGLTFDDAIFEAMDVTPARQQTIPSSPHAEKRSPITRRELDVLRLIVTGKTDREIADDLFVSYRTVTTHMTNILNKLGANSRTEAAAIAVREGLV